MSESQLRPAQNLVLEQQKADADVVVDVVVAGFSSGLTTASLSLVATSSWAQGG